MSQHTISQILISTRTALGVSLQVVGEETKIPLQHLQALEREDFEAFPNYALALGFLRSYAEFLDIDKEHISLLFQKAVNEGLEYKRNPLGRSDSLQKQEKADRARVREEGGSFPLVQKLANILDKRFFIGLLVFVFLLVIILASVFAYSCFTTALSKKDYIYSWDGINIWQGSLKKGENLIIKEGEEKLAEFHVNDSCEASVLLSVVDRSYLVQKGESYLIDFTGNKREDLVLSYDGQILFLRPIPPAELLVTANTLFDRNALFPKIPFSFSSLSRDSLTSCVYASASHKPELTFIQLILKEATLVRYLVDEGPIEESYLPAGTVLDLSFVNSLLLWVADPKVVKVSMGNQPLDLWGDSVLGVGQLIWVQTPKSEFELRFLPL